MAYSSQYKNSSLWKVILIYLLIGGLVYFAAYYFISYRRATSVSPQLPTPPTVQTIQITPSGYQPKTLTIKLGDVVSWTNQSSVTANVSSNPHPTHSDYPPLNLGDIPPGGSVSITFRKVGTYNYHNHLSPDQLGTVIVQ